MIEYSHISINLFDLSLFCGKGSITRGFSFEKLAKVVFFNKYRTASRKKGLGRPTKTSARDNCAMKFIIMNDRKRKLKSMSLTFQTFTEIRFSR